MTLWRLMGRTKGREPRL